MLTTDNNTKQVTKDTVTIAVPNETKTHSDIIIVTTENSHRQFIIQCSYNKFSHKSFTTDRSNRFDAYLLMWKLIKRISNKVLIKTTITRIVY